MRIMPALIVGTIVALSGCDKKADFDASYNNQAANLSAQSDAMQRDMANQMDAANAAVPLANGANTVGDNVVVHAQ